MYDMTLQDVAVLPKKSTCVLNVRRFGGPHSNSLIRFPFCKCHPVSIFHTDTNQQSKDNLF